MLIWRILRDPLLAGLVWALLAFICIGLRDGLGGVMLMWAPSAVVVAALFGSNRSTWPLLCAVLLPMQAIAVWLTGVPAQNAFIYSIASLLQGVIATTIGLAALGGRRSPRYFRQIAGLFVAAITGCLAGALVAIPFRAEQTLAEFSWWFLANVLAILTLTPLILLVRQLAGLGTSPKRPEFGVELLLPLAGCAGLAFVALQVQHVALMPLLVAVMVFASVRYGQIASSVAMLAYAGVGSALSIAVGTPMPNLDAPAEEATLVLQVWMLAMMATSLPIAAMLFKSEELQRELVERNARMHDSLMLFGLAEEVAGIGRWRLDLLTGAQDWSPKMLELNGLPLALAPDPGDVTGLLPDGGDELFSQIAAHRKEREPFTINYRIKPPDGPERFLCISVLNEFDETGRRIAIFGVAMDVTAQIRREEALDLARGRAVRLAAEAQKLANTDTLTSLPNRRCTFERMETMIEVANRRGGTLTAIMFDIDHFKAVNDTYGHQMGDEVLVQVAELARRQARAGDMVGRIGGEEFVWLLPDISDSSARKLAERLRRAVENGREGSRLPPVTVSLGVAHFRPGDSEESLLGRADAALYEAKAGGRNRVQRAA